MIEYSFFQKLSVTFLLQFLRFLNFLNFEIKWYLFTIFTISISLSLWNLKDSSVEDFMKLTRRKPVQNLALTIPESLINNSNDSLNSQNINGEVSSLTAPEVIIPETKLLKLRQINLFAKSYLVYDLKNNKEVTSFNSLEALPPASLVKLLSVLYLTKDLNFSQKFTMTQECTLVNGQKVGFRVDEEVSVKDLVYSSLIYSGADSICLLSRVSSNTSITGLNDFAKSIGLKNSYFTNYIGLDFTGNLTTSEDMLILTKEFLKKDIFEQIVAMKSFELENKRIIYNTNKMLFSEKFAYGVKTGTTDGANENLIYRHKNDTEDIDLVIIILNSSNRYQDTKKILDNLYYD